jgi:hypothetical protein
LLTSLSPLGPCDSSSVSREKSLDTKESNPQPKGATPCCETQAPVSGGGWRRVLVTGVPVKPLDPGTPAITTGCGATPGADVTCEGDLQVDLGLAMMALG